MSQDLRSPATLYGLKVWPIPESTLVEISPGCEICGCSQVRPTLAVAGISSPVVTCCQCGTAFLSPMPTAAEIANFYPRTYYGESGRKFAAIIEFAIHFIGSRHARFLARFVPEHGRVLDVGCGRGTALSKLADRGLEVHGVEMNEAAAIGADSRAQIRIASRLAEANYPDDFFDLVIIWHVLEHLPDPRETLLEVHRILRPRGKVVVAVPNYSSWQARWAGADWFHLDQPRHLFHFPLSTLRSLLESCGLECQSEHHFSVRQNPFGWVQSWLNRTRWYPRNALYELLLRHADSGPLGWWTRAQLRTAFFLGLPLAVGLEILATICRRGATVHIVARAVKSSVEGFES